MPPPAHAAAPSAVPAFPTAQTSIYSYSVQQQQQLQQPQQPHPPAQPPPMPQPIPMAMMPPPTPSAAHAQIPGAIFINLIQEVSKDERNMKGVENRSKELSFPSP